SRCLPVQRRLFVHRLADVFALRVAVPAPHRREDGEAGGNEYRGDRIELRTAPRIWLAAVVPQDRWKRPVSGRFVEIAGERQITALEGDVALVEWGRLRGDRLRARRGGQRRRGRRRGRDGRGQHDRTSQPPRVHWIAPRQTHAV